MKCSEHKVTGLERHTNPIESVSLVFILMAVHTHTFNIVPVSVISHVPSEYNLHNIFITSILNYGSLRAQDIKHAIDCLLLEVDGGGRDIYSNAEFSFLLDLYSFGQMKQSLSLFQKEFFLPAS